MERCAVTKLVPDYVWLDLEVDREYDNYVAR